MKRNERDKGISLGRNIGCRIRKGEEVVWPVSDTESTTYGF
jgi:hypothetical protein